VPAPITSAVAITTIFFMIDSVTSPVWPATVERGEWFSGAHATIRRPLAGAHAPLRGVPRRRSQACAV
jgi:hypothetical protein